MLPLMAYPTCLSTVLLLGAWMSGTLPTQSVVGLIMPVVVDTGESHQADFDKTISDPDDEDAWFSPCEDDWNDGNVAVCETRTFEIAVTGEPLSLDAGENGGVSVEGWTQKGIRVMARIKARAKTRPLADQIAAAVKVLARGTKVRSTGPETGRHESWQVEYRIFVPKKCDLALEAHNGPIRVSNVSGTMDLTTVNGPISLNGLSGAVQARAENGPLTVRLTGRRWVGAGLDAETENGPLTVRLPRNYSAKLETGTIHGPTDMHYELKSMYVSGSRVVATIGSGGPPVRVVTTNGPFSFRESD